MFYKVVENSSEFERVMATFEFESDARWYKKILETSNPILNYEVQYGGDKTLTKLLSDVEALRLDMYSL